LHEVTVALVTSHGPCTSTSFALPVGFPTQFPEAVTVFVASSS
jgi:hypothetical protein